MRVRHIYKKLGKKIRQIRREKSLSQEKLALEAKLNRAYIGYIERGERRPSIETVYKISLALKTPLYKLFLFNHDQ
jgi:transcriptional regulator with XRE-family HTH domain